MRQGKWIFLSESGPIHEGMLYFIFHCHFIGE